MPEQYKRYTAINPHVEVPMRVAPGPVAPYQRESLEQFAEKAAEYDPRYAPMAPSTPDAVNAGKALQDTVFSQKLIDGTPKKLATITSSCGATPMGGYIVAPYLLQDAAVQQDRTIENKGHTFQLIILGHASIGIGGTVYEVDFDVPLGQQVQLQVIATTLELSARLIEKPAVDLSNVFGQDWLYPPIWTSGSLDDTRDPDPFVYVQGMAGIGHIGASNITRRAQTPDASATFTCPAPDFATALKVIADNMATLTFNCNTGGLLPIGPLNCDAPDRPLPSQCVSCDVTTSATGCEYVWRLGFSGVQS
jgi:hypothetical protein